MHTMTLLLFAVASQSAYQRSAGQLNELGLAAAERHDYDTAKRYYQEAIHIWERQGPAYTPHLAIVKTNLAQALGVQGRRIECAALLEEALAGYRKSIGVRDLRSLTALNVLGGIHLMLGDLARASELFEEALPIERSLYPADAQLGRTLSGLASLKMRDGRSEESLPLAEEALQVILQAEGENSVDAALAYANIAEAHRVMGHRDRALPLFRKSRAIYERTLGADHPRVASVLTQEGLLLMADGKLAMAEDALTRSLSLVERACDRCAFELVAAQNNLALLRIRQGKLDEADRLLTGILDLQERVPEAPPSELAVTLQSLAVVRQREKRFDDAERLKRRADLLMAYR